MEKSQSVGGEDDHDSLKDDVLGVSTVGERKRQKHLVVGDDGGDLVDGDNENTRNAEDERQQQQIIHRIINKLTSDSDFFDQNTPRPLAEFSLQEIKYGKILGEGEFGTVCQIESFRKHIDGCGCRTICGNRQPKQPTSYQSSSIINNNKHTKGVKDAPIASIPVVTKIKDDDGNRPTNLGDEDIGDDISDLDEHEEEEEDYRGDKNHGEGDGEAAYMRDYLIHHVYRCGQYRYAIKRVRMGIHNKYDRIQAVIDMAMETKILSAINHPNIVKVRAIMGTYGQPDDFGIIMDRLNETLRDKIEEWSIENKKSKGNLLQRLSGRGLRLRERRDELLVVRLYALYDIARALRHIREKNILYRDLKPENVGVNLRGEYLIFDFGLAKELKRRDLVEPPDGFALTGLTGTRRYLAPEVCLCKNYGFSADVYSYSILFWETIALKIPFRSMTRETHFDQVVVKGRRPEQLRNISLPKQLQKMMEDGWSSDPFQRPTFNVICEQLKKEISSRLAHTTGNNLEDRTNDLMNASHVSRTESIKECC